MMSITGAFSSLGINERSPNQGGIKLPKNFSTMSLPNLVSAERRTISPSFVRNNYCDDEIESSDQPIDFSKKYCETKMVGGENKVMKPPHNCAFDKSYDNTFTMYAETDLDQPTDYSLRYAEDDSDSEECNKIPKAETAEFVQDTIKTYCTEDTPYETPFNFSTSTSMSDLRIDEKAPIDNKSDAEAKQANPKDKIVKSGFSSGLMSPEKPVNYCEEGTPGYFSRVDSCGSLNSIPVNDPPKQDLKEGNLESEKVCDKEPRRVGKFPSETKAVKFEEVVNYAEETPLMFSRSSSLASLDSIEQHSIHDDRSSVVSDFSRLTSGLISPSELPDSPSQTVPPSPKPRKNPLVFPQVAKKKTEEESTQTDSQNVPKSSVFEDVVKKFKMESTPLQFSTATSLSSLIDDHDEIDSKIAQHDHNETDSVNQNDKNELNNLENELSESSEDEDMLAACINIGMQNNRYSQPKSDVANNSRPTPRNSPQHLPVASAIEINQNNPVQKSDMTSDSLRTYCTEDTPAILSQAGSNSDLSLLSMHVDNKIVADNNDESLATQVQNLKINDLQEDASNTEQQDNANISLDIEPNDDNHSRRSSFSSLSDASHESEQALLQECILAGMPKGNASTKPTIPIVQSVPEKTNDLTTSDPLLDFAKVENESSDDEDEDILANCINIGMKNNRYNTNFKFQPPNLSAGANPVKSNKPEAVNDSIRSYCTEDTPAVLSNAGSNSDLSVLSMQGNENGVVKDYLSDLNSNFSDDDDDERLLAECVRYGMAKISGTAAKQGPKLPNEQKYADLNISLETNAGDGQSLSSSDESYDSEALLQECILAGMPKPKPADDPAELTAAEKALLQQCILEGMRKCRIAPKKPIEDDTSELTEAEQALLRQCILSGMPKNKNLTQGGPSGSRDSTALTASERLLLQQCILAGMPKSRNGSNSGRFNPGVGNNRQWLRRPQKEQGGEHNCCIHCPRNGANRAALRQGNHVKSRRKYREREQVQVRERRDVNILYVTSQILAIKKEIVDRAH